MSFGFNILINAFDFFILHQYNQCFSKERRYTKRTNVLIYIALVVISALVNQLANEVSINIINLIGTILLIILYSLTYIMPSAYYVILTVIYFGFGFVAELLSFVLFSYYVNFLPEKLQYPVTVIICEIIRFIFVLVIRKVKNSQMPKLDKRTLGMLIMIPLLSVGVCYIAINLITSDKKEFVNTLCVSLIILMFLINVMFWIIYQKLVSSIADTHESQMILQEAQAKEQYYREIENYNKEIRIIKHDIKNRLLALSSQVPINNKVNDEIQRVIEELEPANNNIFTSNSVFNTIINSKQKIAESKQVKMKISIQIPEKLDIEYSDAGILLGNLIDNGIEACEKVKGERKIDLKIVYKQGILILKIRNSKTDDEVDISKSTKNDVNNHGLGIKSVRKIVNKYNGSIDFVDHENEFEVVACLYNVETFI